MSETHELRPLAQRAALVTGGGTGIGRAIALALAGAGASVAITGRRREPLDACAAEIEATGSRALVVTGDVADAADARRMVEETATAFGALHILVNNAGIALNGALEDHSTEDVDALVDIDLKGPIHVTRAALPHLRAQRETGTSVLNISSSVTFMATRNFSVYSAAKAGVEMLTRCWALDWAADRIRVNAISPGVVDTPIFSALPTDQHAQVMAHFAQQTPLGRVGHPTDIAHLALFLASPQAAWITGAVVPVDGGLSLGA